MHNGTGPQQVNRLSENKKPETKQASMEGGEEGGKRGNKIEEVGKRKRGGKRGHRQKIAQASSNQRPKTKLHMRGRPAKSHDLKARRTLTLKPGSGPEPLKKDNLVFPRFPADRRARGHFQAFDAGGSGHAADVEEAAFAWASSSGILLGRSHWTRCARQSHQAG